MKKLLVTLSVSLFVLGCSCHAGGVKAQTLDKLDKNIVKGEYLVLLEKTKDTPETIVRTIKTDLSECTVSLLAKDVIYLVFKTDDDPGLEKIRDTLLKYKWFKLVEHNRKAKISL